MLTIYRRHLRACTHRAQGREYRHCRCPIWVDGIMKGERIGSSLRTRDWQRAQGIVRDWEAEDRVIAQAPACQPTTIAQACEKFEADAQARKLNDATIYKYKLLFRRLKAFTERRGLRFLNELDVDTLSAFRAEWNLGPRSSLKKLERLRAFLGFAQQRAWIGSNPARKLKVPKVPVRPTLPFTHEEILRILAAIGRYAERAGLRSAQRLRAFVLLLRYSGMRIGDAVQCGTDRITGDRLFLYTQKTGVPVHLKLPDFVVQALEAAPRTSERYFFWTGESKSHSAIGKWQRRLQALFRLAKISGGHAHRFRDTFAVELLHAGVPLERISVLLGHQSIRVTEKHYAPWVRSRQDQLEADLERAWSQDPVALLQDHATPLLHGKERVQ